MKAYSDRQIRAGDLLEDVTIKGEKIPTDVINQIVELIGVPDESNQSTDALNAQRAEDVLKVQLLNEPDWRKRAAIAALIISRSLE